MKIKEIAEKYGVDREEFERFIKTEKLNFKSGLFGSISIEDDLVPEYTQKFKKHLEEVAEKERIRREEEEKRIAAERAKEEARRLAEAEEAKRRAEEEAARKKKEEEERAQRIQEAEEEFRAAEEKEMKDLAAELNIENFSELTDEERRGILMANCVKLYREKLKGTWEMKGGITDNVDLFGVTYLSQFSYNGIDGEELIGKDFQGKSFNYKIYVTGTETGKVMLYVSGNPITFHATIGEIAFSDDNNSFTLTGSTSFFVFERV